jgi:hypothetical protein
VPQDHAGCSTLTPLSWCSSFRAICTDVKWRTRTTDCPDRRRVAMHRALCGRRDTPGLRVERPGSAAGPAGNTPPLVNPSRRPRLSTSARASARVSSQPRQSCWGGAPAGPARLSDNLAGIEPPVKENPPPLSLACLRPRAGADALDRPRCQPGFCLHPGGEGIDSTVMARAHPTPDESFARLHAAGWSVGETGTAGRWLVSGTNGENQLAARGSTQAEAWYRACEQAAAVGMLRNRGGTGGADG